MRRKITFIISLILFQIFYLLSHYTVQYLNLFFLLTCLSALVVCYNLYRLLMQIFIGQKTEAELNLLKKQQALNAEHLQLVRQQETTCSKHKSSLPKLCRPFKRFCAPVIVKTPKNSFMIRLTRFSVTVFILIVKTTSFSRFWNRSGCLQNNPVFM